MVKVNFVGATFKTEKKSGIGVVIQDDQGVVLASLSKLLPQNHNPLKIEMLVASTAVQFASELGFSNIALEGDSHVLMQAIIHDRPFLSLDGLLIDDLRFNARCFNQLHYSHIRRECNMVAHRLSRYTLNVLEFVVWMEDVPPQIVSSVLADITGLT